MAEMPLELAYEIYARKFWHKMSLDLIWEHSDVIAEELFDSGVNLGTYYPQEWLQRSLNVLNKKGTHYADIKVDGDIGRLTAAALGGLIKRRGKEGVLVLYSMLNGFQSVYYTELAERREKDEEFCYGWQLQRVLRDMRSI